MLSTNEVQTAVGCGERESARETGAYLEKEFFSRLRPRELFLLITRTSGGLPEEQAGHPRERVYIGRAGNAPSLVIDEDHGVFKVPALQHVVFGERGPLVRQAQEPLTLPTQELRYVRTALPRGDGVRAIELYATATEVEGVCIHPSSAVSGLLRKLLVAHQLLGWSISSRALHKARECERQQLISHLFASRFCRDRRESLLKQALDLGFDHDTEYVQIGVGFHRTSEIIADLKRIAHE